MNKGVRKKNPICMEVSKAACKDTGQNRRDNLGLLSVSFFLCRRRPWRRHFQVTLLLLKSAQQPR